MFQHDKLDWTLSRLEKMLGQNPDDVGARTDLAAACLSRSWFHDGGESWANQALAHARRVLHHDPGSQHAMVIAGLSLALMDRPEPATRYLDQAVRIAPEDAKIHLALGELNLRRGNRHQAVQEFEFACRQAPNSWEPNALLGRLLRQRAETLGNPTRVLERSQYHLVKALSNCTSQVWKPRLMMDLAVACMQTGRFADANKLLARLVEQSEYRLKARYYLGLVSIHAGKYKNAILHLRQHAEERGDHPEVHARIGICYLQLGEIRKARESCNHALTLDPGHLTARHTLGCALLEEGRNEEASRLFREILSDAPDHLPSFREVVKLRRAERDADWLERALRTEITSFDRLPVAVNEGYRVLHPRQATKQRIELLVEAFCETGEQPETTLVDLTTLTTDEPLRASLWESAVVAMASARASFAKRWVAAPGQYFSAERGQEVAALATYLPEGSIQAGLQLSEEDLQRAAVDRHGPATDVVAHRRHVEFERQEARAWQAMVLVALGQLGGSRGHNLLLRWAAESDPELAVAARASLAIGGEGQAVEELQLLSRSQVANKAIAKLINGAQSGDASRTYRLVSNEPGHICSSCGRHSTEVDHMMIRSAPDSTSVICDHCLAAIATRRPQLATDDPSVACAFTGRSIVDSQDVYVFNGVAVADEVVEHSLGLAEREAVNTYLANW